MLLGRLKLDPFDSRIVRQSGSNRQPMTLHVCYAASRISSMLKGSTKIISVI